LEELGLLKDKDIQARWQKATENAENQRAANIAKNVKSVEAKEGLEKAADVATAKVVEAVTKDMRIYVIVDRSGSMEGAIERAKEYLTKFVGAFPLDRLHVSVFNTVGTEVKIKAATAVGVAQAFRGVAAGGGTSYAEGVRCLLERHLPKENEDALLIFVGDQEDHNVDGIVRTIQMTGVSPVAFGMLHVASLPGGQHGGFFGRGDVVERAAVEMGIPCFQIEEGIFADPYAVPRTIRNLIAATPVRKAVTMAAPVRRTPLIEEILNTPLLSKPVWA